ncbi:glycosyltransferase family 4 protein [Paludicola sp. MB14-C6]|uniref:glycosyltransferase family 4 protein n=1 Tax=Paludihabitans sp. MB14-C6 TaxID=3070656 RepID=UPI0027DE134C|nr:glycosyltransferase family 4 protein [Paludicola sp. MB14-C6]WMJ22590.1 glycosyltransferase family 4 protein [Paludicola sp. MB14-C6]
MNIMIINHYAGSDEYGMEFRPFYMGRELVKLGHDVTVIAADCSHLRKKNPSIQKSFQEEYIDGVRYVFIKTTPYVRNDLKRLLNVKSFLKTLKRNRKAIYEKYRPNVIVASSTYPYDVKVAKQIAEYDANIKVCFEIHDIWPLSLIELYHISPKNFAMRHIQRAANYAYENVDAVISILPHVDRHIKELGYHDVNYTYIPNGVIVDNADEQQPPVEIVDAVSKLKEQGKFVLMYLGGFSKANALDDLMASAEYMNENIQIVMVGGGPLKEMYTQEISDKQIKNIAILPSVLKTQVNQTLKLADALYIGAKKTPLYRFGVGMNKIFDYMLSKRPMIYAIESSNDYAKEANCGISIPSEDSKAIAEAALQLSKMAKEQLDKLGINGYEYVLENHNYEKLAKRFLNVLQ